VSYALRLAVEAQAGVAALPAELQEQALDLVDGLTSEPWIANRPPPRSRSEVVDFAATYGGALYTVFAVYRVDHRTRTVIVETVGHYARPM
jgi:hypothetical protein